MCIFVINQPQYILQQFNTFYKNGDIMNILTQKEFKEKFPEVSTYGIEMHMPVFLENGEILLDTQWNGEQYLVKGKSYSPFYKETEEDTEIIGYYED